MQVYSEIFQYRGNHYDFGYKQGELLRNSPILPNRKVQWGKRHSRHSIIDPLTFEKIMEEFAPRIMDEIHGLADALSYNWEDAIREFGGYYLEYGRSGCSIFSDTGQLVRNYDNEPLTYEGRYVLFQPTDGGYASIGPTMQITGRTDGINEKGLAIGYNFVNRKNSNDGFVCNMIARIILESCTNTLEAIELLKEIPHRHSFNYVLVDKNSNPIVVEASSKKVVTRSSNYCTNHFHLLNDENRYQYNESAQRELAIQENAKFLEKPMDSFQMMNNTKSGVFSMKYGAWAGTIHTAAYFSKELKAWFSLGGDQAPVIFDFDKWLNGENLMIKRVKGKLESKTGFINMADNGKVLK